tara:strand:- start:10150 stop:13530 length:3381 start_codon:yes stop_codon:yes gene_type:complete
MADIKYISLYESLNGQQFRFDLWDKNYTGVAIEGEMFLGSQSPTITYDADGDKKFNDVLASTLEWTYIIKDDDDKEWVDTIILFGEEKDIYVHLYEMAFNGTEKYIWGGYLLMDLSSTPDVSYPYEVSFRAVDGIALLKEKKWLVEGATGYTTADTYIPLDKQRFTTWFFEIVQKMEPAAIINGASQEWEMHTVNRWYNTAHNASSILDDPTYLTWCTTRGFYELKDNGEWNPASTYDVLVGMLKSWGMRLVYWQGVYHFIQVNEYITPETGSLNNQANMYSHHYNSGGSYTGTNNYLGNNSFSRYEFYISIDGADAGLQKLEGTEYTYLPAIKNSIVEFQSIEDINYFQGYPDMFTTAQINYMKNNSTHRTNSKPLGVWTDAHNGAGWYFYLVMNLAMNVTNGGGNQCSAFAYHWTIRAREDGTSPWTYMLKLNTVTNTLTWISYSVGWDAWQPTSLSDLLNGTNMGSRGVWMLVNIPNSQGYNADSLIFDSGATANGKIPEPSWAATGGWEFEIATVGVAVDALQNVNGMYTNGGARRGLGNQGTQANPISGPYALSIPNAMARSNAANSENMGITYDDPIGAPLQNGGINYHSMFSAIMTASNNVGYTITNTFVTSTTTDTKTNVIKGVKYGDTTSPNAPGTLWIEDDATGVLSASTPTGTWARDTAGGILSFSELLCKQVIDNQYHANPVLNGTIMCSKKNKIVSADPSFGYFKGLNPLCRIVDRDANPYILRRGAWDSGKDEWSGEWWQVINTGVSTTTTTNGGSDDPGNDDNNVFQPMTLPPGWGGEVMAQHNTQSKIGQFDGSTVYPNLAKAFEVTRTTAGLDAGTKTSIDIDIITDYNGDDVALLKAGMKLVIVDIDYKGQSYLHLHEITLSADQLAGDTTLTFDAIVLTDAIQAGMKIDVNVEEMFTSAFNSQGEITLTTTGTSGAATLVGDTLNIPQYAGGGTIQNFSWCACTGTTSTSGTDGEAVAVVVPFDTESITSSVDTITLYGASGVVGASGGEYAFGMEPGTFEVSWNITTTPDININRIIVGAKLEKGLIDGDAIVWADYDPTHSYIYNRGVTGTPGMKLGSTSNTTLLEIPEDGTSYYRIVIWKDESSNGSTTGLTVLNGTSLIIKEI